MAEAHGLVMQQAAEGTGSSASHHAFSSMGLLMLIDLQLCLWTACVANMFLIGAEVLL